MEPYVFVRRSYLHTRPRRLMKLRYDSDNRLTWPPVAALHRPTVSPHHPQPICTLLLRMRRLPWFCWRTIRSRKWDSLGKEDASTPTHTRGRVVGEPKYHSCRSYAMQQVWP